MDNHTIGWIVLIFILFLTTFGVYWCLIVFASILIFVIGLITLLYIQEGDVDKFYRHCAGNPLTSSSISDGGLAEVVKKLLNPKKELKYDIRVTGSDIIDSSLQEILGYVVRDYIIPWYNLISLDSEFPQKTVKKTAQSLAINISNRVKDVDWIPFLTTKLVDDATTHLKLFKQARIKMKQDEPPKSPRNSPRKEIRASPKKTHKRNKSETDVNWYFGNRNVVECREVEHNAGNNKLYAKDSNKKSATLEDYFFDLECAMDKNNVCRDLICIEIDKEKEFLSELVEILLYILLPDEDFQCKPIRYIVREIFVNCVVFPVFTMISDPDYINQAVVWLCLRDVSLPSEIFLSTLRSTDNCDELKYTKEMVVKEIQVLRSRDSGGESDLSIKQQLSSLMYVLKLIDNRLTKVNNIEITDSLYPTDYSIPLEGLKVDLPLNVILVNNVALSYFIDYVSSHGIHACLFFYLNIEGWKISVEQQLSDMQINKLKGLNENTSAVYENIRSTATNLYDQYLGDKREQKIDINHTLVHKLYFKLKNLSETPSELWFDDIQMALFEKLKIGDEYLPAFKQSHTYLKLLEELDLLQQQAEDDAISLNSLECTDDENVKSKEAHQNEYYPSIKALKSGGGDNFLSIEPVDKSLKHVRSLSDVTDFSRNKYDILESNKSVATSAFKSVQNNGCAVEKHEGKEKEQKTGDYTLNVDIIQTGVINEKGKAFGVYALHVSKQYVTGFIEEWHIYRRYSDFYDLHNRIKDKFSDLSKLTFPGKKTFHNTDRAVLERRMRMLGCYMHTLCKDSIINTHVGLKELLMTFLEQGEYDRANSGGPISHTIDTLVNPLKSGMKTIKNMPEQIINTMDEVVEGINKVFHSKQGAKSLETTKLGATIDPESDDNIPLRIMLLLMDEVFDLKSKNQWLRRRIVTLLRQIVRTMFGDIVNRRILDYVSFITSPKNVAHYLHVFKQSFWPNGVKAEKKPERDDGIKFRTRIAAKIALLSCQSDELKHIIGSETTRKGLMTVFEIFQRPILNRRLLYMLLEDILSTLFPEKNVSEIFLRLYSKSKRYQDKQKQKNTHRHR